MIELSNFYNLDCMEGLRKYPDSYFDLAIVDPPYGNDSFSSGNRFGGWFKRYALDSTKVTRTGGTWAKKYSNKIVSWDTKPSKEYFDLLSSKSRQAIVWGGELFFRYTSAFKELYNLG